MGWKIVVGVDLLSRLHDYTATAVFRLGWFDLKCDSGCFRKGFVYASLDRMVSLAHF